MYYTLIDYYVLAALRDKKIALDALLEAACASLPYPISKVALAFSLGKLAAGGYIENYALTDKGFAFFKSNKRFLESKTRANTRMCALLCAEQIEGNIAPYELSDAAYIEACDALRCKYSIPSPEFSIVQGENSLILRFAGGYADPENEDDWRDEQSVAVNPASLCALMNAFARFYEDGKHRKCCLYAEGAPAFVATVSVNDETTRLSISRILFNRQRFIGKCDGDLDYAQCGETVFDRTDSKLEESLVLAMLEAESLIGEQFPYASVAALWEMC